MQSSELGRFGPYVSGSELVCRKLGRFGPYVSDPIIILMLGPKRRSETTWGPKRPTMVHTR